MSVTAFNPPRPGPFGPIVQPASPTGAVLGVTNFGATSILNSIFQHILDMTTTLQDVAAAQANRLNVLTAWQKAYTDIQAQIPTFVAGGAGHFRGTTTQDKNDRDDMNRLNSSYTQTLQNRQSVVSDAAKALQSNVNQSNDAVNTQSNLGTAILQELSSLLGSIFH